MKDEVKESQMDESCSEQDKENETRREFFASLGKWSKVVIGAIVAGSVLKPADTDAKSWFNSGGGWHNGGWKNGGWHNGGWKNGGWHNGGWHNGGWRNRWKNGGWYNGWNNGGWYNNGWSDGGWYNGGWSDYYGMKKKDKKQ